MEKEKLKIVAEFLKEMQEKYPVKGDDKIVVELNNNMIIVYQNSPVSYESDWWEELERFELK
jgi:hypothetical protein